MINIVGIPYYKKIADIKTLDKVIKDIKKGDPNAIVIVGIDGGNQAHLKRVIKRCNPDHIVYRQQNLGKTATLKDILHFILKTPKLYKQDFVFSHVDCDFQQRWSELIKKAKPDKETIWHSERKRPMKMAKKRIAKEIEIISDLFLRIKLLKQYTYFRDNIIGRKAQGDILTPSFFIPKRYIRGIYKNLYGKKFSFELEVVIFATKNQVPYKTFLRKDYGKIRKTTIYEDYALYEDCLRVIDKHFKGNIPSIIIQARMGSNRFPGKQLKKIKNKTILEHVIERAQHTGIQRIIVATTNKKEDEKIADLAIKKGVLVFQGSENNLLSRYYFCAKKFNCGPIIRITGDNPLFDPMNVFNMVEEHIKHGAEITFTLNTPIGTGLGHCVMSYKLLEKLNRYNLTKEEKEHIMPYLMKNIHKLKARVILKDLNPNIYLTVDTLQDLIYMRKLFSMIKNPNDFEEVYKCACSLL